MEEPTPLSPSLARPGLAAELRAFAAVVWREWLIFVRYPSWIVSLLVWPFIFPLAYLLTARAFSGTDGAGLEQFRSVTGLSDYIGFIAVGSMLWMWQNMVLWSVGFLLRNEQLRGTLESNWLSPTWRFSYLVGGSIPQLLSMLAVIAVSLLEYVLFFGVRFEGSLWLTLLVILVAIPSIYGLGFAFASLVINVREAYAFVFMVRGVLLVFCGVTYPLAILPGWMQSVAAWLPQTYITRAVRSAALSQDGLPAILPDLWALAAFGACWMVAGYLVFTLMERRARQTGAIGQY